MGKQSAKFAQKERLQQLEEAIESRSKLFSHLSASTLALLFVAVITQFDLDSLKGILVDGLYRSQWWETPRPDIELIAYDDASRVRYDTTARIPAEELAQVLEALAAESPRAVAVLHTLSERHYSEPELRLIGKSLRKLPHALVGYIDDDSLGKNPPAALGEVSFLPGFVSRDTFSYGADSVSRRVMITIQSIPTVYAELARKVAGRETFSNASRLGALADSEQTYIDWQGGPGTYPITSSRDVAQRDYPQGRFRDKVVLIGRALKGKPSEDFIFTPFSRRPVETTLLEGAAHSTATLLSDRGLYRVPSWLNVVLSLMVGLLTVNLVLFLPPWRGILFVLGEIVALTGVAWVFLAFFGTWIDLAHPLVVACVGYYMVIPYRLVDESRKRWHYQEKSELMAQLEQLKSNFLSLVSHDLKTPIARIQGNAELLLTEQTELPENQRQYLSAILQTTDNLSQYVETVLDLTRIESAQVPLQKTSKDINAVIQEVVESKRMMAAERGIGFVTNLDPIFSFKFDVRLMKRVLSNLVENAIKYSPDGSTITLSSREEDNWIHVSVEDEGFGIAPEEQDKVFGKFYRCQRSEASEVKGTGLGLYLVKYFVELHDGIVRLKSEVNRGTTFTISLPVS